MSNKDNNLYEFGGFRLDPETKLLFRQDELIPIAPKVFDTLHFLVSNPGVVHSKDALLDSIWGDSFVEESNLSQNIYLLRKALGEGFIETVPKRGYRFIASVVALEKPEEDVAILLERNQVRTVFPSRTSTRLYLGGSILVGFLALMTAGILYLYSSAGASNPTDTFANVDVKMLVDSGAAIDPVISDDGQFVAYISRGGGKEEGIWLLDVEAGTDVRIDVPRDYKPSYLRFSSNGKKIYFRDSSDADKANIVEVSRFGGAAKIVAKDVWSPFSISPDGKSFAFYRREQGAVRLIVSDVVTGKENKFTRDDGSAGSFTLTGYPAWSKNGDSIFCIAGRGTIYKSSVVKIDRNLTSSTELPRNKFHEIRAIAADIDDKHIFLIARELNRVPQVYRMRISDSSLQRLTNDFNSYFDLSVTRDGKRLAVRQRKRHANIWHVPDLDTSKAKQLTFGMRVFEGKQGIELLPDNKILLVATRDTPFDLWTTDLKGKPIRRLTDKIGVVKRFPSISYAKNLVYFDSTEKKSRRIRSVSLENGGLSDVTDGSKGRDSFPVVSKDEKALYFIRGSKSGRRIIRKDLVSGNEVPIEILKKHPPRDALMMSPDGAKLAYRFSQAGGQTFGWQQSNEVSKICVVDLKTPGECVVLSISFFQRGLRWAEDSSGLEFIQFNDGDSALYRQDLDSGTTPSKLAELKGMEIYNFKRIPGSQDMLVSHGDSENQVLMLTLKD